MIGVLNTVVCLLTAHRFEKQPTMIPEDRVTYQCDRCGETRLVPSSAMMPSVPYDQREQEDLPTEKVNTGDNDD